MVMAAAICVGVLASFVLSGCRTEAPYPTRAPAPAPTPAPPPLSFNETWTTYLDAFPRRDSEQFSLFIGDTWEFETRGSNSYTRTTGRNSTPSQGDIQSVLFQEHVYCAPESEFQVHDAVYDPFMIRHGYAFWQCTNRFNRTYRMAQTLLYGVSELFNKIVHVYTIRPDAQYPDMVAGSQQEDRSVGNATSIDEFASIWRRKNRTEFLSLFLEDSQILLYNSTSEVDKLHTYATAGQISECWDEFFAEVPIREDSQGSGNVIATYASSAVETGILFGADYNSHALMLTIFVYEPSPGIRMIKRLYGTWVTDWSRYSRTAEAFV